MAKVLVSIPDDLLREVDARTKVLGETRSGYLRRLAERDLQADEERRMVEFGRLMALIRADFREDEPQVDIVKLIREDRESH